MAERSEQEQLSDLVGGEDLEPIVTGDLLAEGLKHTLGDPHPSQVAAMTNEIESHGDVAISPVKKAGQPDQPAAQQTASSEKLLLVLYDIKDNLVDAFGGCKLNSSLANNLTNQINKVGSCIVHLGGTAEAFDPLNYVSGLELPDVVKNAEEVVQRTMQCYKLGSVEEAKIKEDGTEINIVFAGNEDGVDYRATGRIIAKAWTGNEAIDYVYTPSAGKMSVKAFEGGRWVNKSETEDYHISWELNEQDLSQDSAETSTVKEEVPQNAQNKETEIQDADGEEDIGSPIS